MTWAELIPIARRAQRLHTVSDDPIEWCKRAFSIWRPYELPLVLQRALARVCNNRAPDAPRCVGALKRDYRATPDLLKKSKELIYASLDFLSGLHAQTA